MNTTGPDARLRNAPSTRGGVVLVSLYSWTCITLIGAIARFVVGLQHNINFGLDDGTMLGGSVVYTGATVAWQYAVNGGLGKHFSEVSEHDRTMYFKSLYAAKFLQILAMAFAKLSSAFLIGRVAPQTRRQNTILFGIVIAWTIYSLFATAFQCGTPAAWRFDISKCGHGGPLYSIIALNMLSDIVLAAWIFPTLRTLNMDKEKRITVAILFGSRAVVALFSCGEIWAVDKAANGNDPTWDTYELALFTQAVTSLSLIVASLPRIKRFLGVAGSGMSRPIIDETELAQSHKAPSGSGSRTGSEPLKLIPSNSGHFTTTVMSGKSGKKDKNKIKGPQEWQKFVSMGSKQDDHTSTSSLFDHQGGVMMQHEVTVKVEDSDSPD